MTSKASFLDGVSVLDLGLGMSSALVSKFLRECGADVTRFEPGGGDPFYAVYPAYRSWRNGVSVQSASGVDDPGIAEAAQTSDICIVGGEDFPQLEWRFDADALQAGNPRLIVVDIAAMPAVEGEEPIPAHDLLAQARSGFSYEHYSERPIAFGYLGPTYGAVLNALTGLLAALIEREASGKGQIVATSLVEGALDACRSQWFNAETKDLRFLARVPKDTRMTIFRCKDGRYVHLMMGTQGAKDRFYKLLDLDPEQVTDTLNDRGMPTGRGDPRMFWGDIDAFAKPIERWTSTEFIQLLQQNGFPCTLVSEPGECWSLPQVAENDTLATTPEGYRFVGLPIRGL